VHPFDSRTRASFTQLSCEKPVPRYWIIAILLKQGVSDNCTSLCRLKSHLQHKMILLDNAKMHSILLWGGLMNAMKLSGM